MLKNKFSIERKFVYLTILAIFYLFMRLLILVSSMDKVYYEVDLYRGVMAKELISRPILPFLDYQFTQWEGGSLIVGALAIPFFLLLGESLFALKLVALSFSLGIFILWYLFLEKFFHRRVAVFAGLLFVLSPPFYTKGSLMAAGSHHESILFTTLTMFIFYQIFFVKEKKSLFILLGLVSGFALFFGYMFGVTLFTILLLWFVLDKKFIFGKNFLSFAISFLVGFSPWIYYNLTHNFEGFILADKPMLYWFTKNSFPDSLMRIRNLITVDIRNSFCFEDIGFLNHRFLSNAYYLIFVLSFCVLFFLNRRSILKLVLGIIPHRRFKVLPKEISKDTFLIIFPIIFSIIFSVSAFKFSFRDVKVDPAWFGYGFIVPLYPFIFTIIALFLYRTAKASKHLLISYFNSSLMIILLCLGLVSNFNLVSMDNLGKGFTYKIYKGYNYFDLGRLLCLKFYNNVDRAIQLTKKVDHRFRRYCYAGMGWGIRGSFSYPYKMTVANYIKHIGSMIDEEYWPDAYERLGRVIEYNNNIAKELRDNLDTSYHPYFYRGFGAKEAKRLVHDLKEYARLIVSINTEYQPYFHEGIGIELDEALINDTEGFIQFMNAIDEKFRPYIYKGLAKGREYYQFNYDKFGFGIGSIGYNIAVWNKIINKIEDKYKPNCYQRLGIEIGWRFIHDIKKYRLFLEQADTQYRPSLYKGLGIGIGWRFGYDINGCVQLIKEIDQKYWPFVYEGLGAGVARRYGYQLDDWVEEIKKVPAGYESYFDKGVGEIRNVWRFTLN